MPVFAGMNARHARVGFDVDGHDNPFEHESIDEGFEAGGTRVIPLPQRQRAHRARQALANITAVVAHHRQALSQPILLLLGEIGHSSGHQSSSHPATASASARVNAP